MQPGNGLPGFSLYKPQPGHPDWRELYVEALERCARISDVIVKDKDITLADRLENLDRKRKAYVTTVRTFLENRRRLKDGDHNLLAIYWVWAMQNACNLRCTYCDDHAGQGWFDKSDRNTLGTEAGKKLMRIMRTSNNAVYFCGGEPTLRDDLWEFVDEGWRLGNHPMVLNSNITIIDKRLEDPRWKDVMRKLDVMVMSVDSLNPDKLDATFGRPLGRQVLTNALMLWELRKQNYYLLIANSVVTPDTIQDAKEVLDWCCDLDIFYAAVPANKKGGPDFEMIDSKEYREYVETVLERKRAGYKVIGSHRLLDKFLNARPYNCMTTLKPHIGPDGSWPWPCRASINVEPEIMNVLDHENVHDIQDAAARIIEPTRFHGNARNQCGGKCAWYQNYTTEIYRETLIRPWRFIAEVRELTANM